jgi:predicted dehydrogenase
MRLFGWPLWASTAAANDLASQFVQIPGVDIVCICDVDSRAAAKCAEGIGKKQSRTPRTETDFRKALDDPGIDALVIAAPDHWHAPATVLACAAGKHVYCEKPACHNPHEGELMVAAARKHKRVVQLGTQRRSMPGIIEGFRDSGRAISAG